MVVFNVSKSTLLMVTFFLPTLVGAVDFQNENRCLEGLNSVSKGRHITTLKTVLHTVTTDETGQQQTQKKDVIFSFSKAESKSTKIHYVYTDKSRYKCDTSNVKNAEFYRFVLPRASGQADGFVNIKISEGRGNDVSYRHHNSGDQYVALYFLGKATVQLMSNDDPKKVVQNVPDYVNTMNKVEKDRQEATQAVTCTESLDENSESILRSEVANRHAESSMKFSDALKKTQLEFDDPKMTGKGLEPPRMAIQRIRDLIDKTNKACEGMQDEMKDLIITRLDPKPADDLLRKAEAEVSK